MTTEGRVLDEKTSGLVRGYFATARCAPVWDRVEWRDRSVLCVRDRRQSCARLSLVDGTALSDAVCVDAVADLRVDFRGFDDITNIYNILFEHVRTIDSESETQYSPSVSLSNGELMKWHALGVRASYGLGAVIEPVWWRDLFRMRRSGDCRVIDDATQIGWSSITRIFAAQEQRRRCQSASDLFLSPKLSLVFSVYGDFSRGIVLLLLKVSVYFCDSYVVIISKCVFLLFILYNKSLCHINWRYRVITRNIFRGTIATKNVIKISH